MNIGAHSNNAERTPHYVHFQPRRPNAADTARTHLHPVNPASGRKKCFQANWHVSPTSQESDVTAETDS
ncbi:MAG: hypothetical protein CMM07_26745 [Rhodopirellula sp.]|nr:hypothetical protein [Rhodopirellula sp.]